MADHPGAPATLDHGWSKRVLEHARPFIFGPSGDWKFWPTLESGPWNAAALRLIVDELERRNIEQQEARFRGMKERLAHAKRVTTGEEADRG